MATNRITCGKVFKDILWQLNQRIEVKYVDTRTPEDIALARTRWALCRGLQPRDERENHEVVGWETVLLNFTSCESLSRVAALLP